MPLSCVLERVQVEEFAKKFRGGPNPLYEITLEGTVIHKSAVRDKTVRPTWDDKVEVKSEEKNFKLTISVYHEARARRWLKWIPTTGKRLVGSVGITNEDLSIDDPTLISQDLTRDISKAGVKAGVVKLTFTHADRSPQGPPPPPPKEVAPEVHPDAAPSNQTKVPEYSHQTAGFQDKEIELSQIERMVQQVLAQAPKESSTAGPV